MTDALPRLREIASRCATGATTLSDASALNDIAVQFSRLSRTVDELVADAMEGAPPPSDAYSRLAWSRT